MLPFEVLSWQAPWLRPLPQSPFVQKTQTVHCRRARAAVRAPCLHCRLSLQTSGHAGHFERGEDSPCWHALSAPDPPRATLKLETLREVKLAPNWTTWLITGTLPKLPGWRAARRLAPSHHHTKNPLRMPVVDMQRIGFWARGPTHRAGQLARIAALGRRARVHLAHLVARQVGGLRVAVAHQRRARLRDAGRRAAARWRPARAARARRIPVSHMAHAQGLSQEI